jgi:hypothetical protein
MDTEQQPRDLLTNDQEPSAEYWQSKVERLQEALCFLLMKNQTMRMALSAEKATEPFSESVAAYTNRDMYSRDAVARADRRNGVDLKTKDSLNCIVPTNRSLPAGNANRKERTMEARLNAQQASPAAYTAMLVWRCLFEKHPNSNHRLSNS